MGIQEPLVEEETNMKEDELEEEEETLSLCDLPLYSDQSADWDDHYLSSNSNSNSNSISTTTSSQQDFFEFFSQELSPSSATAAAFFPPENIIFCGKLIPYKQLSPPCKTNPITSEKIKSQTSHKKSSRWRWRLSSGKASKVSIQPQNGSKCTTGLMHQPQRRTYNSSKQLGSYKAKWYFYLFGVSRSFSPVVELSDIRSRQSRRRSRSPPRSPAMFGGGDGKVGDRRWGLMWGLIRALSCGGGNQPTAVTAVAPPPE